MKTLFDIDIYTTYKPTKNNAPQAAGCVKSEQPDICAPPYKIYSVAWCAYYGIKAIPGEGNDGYE